MAYIQLSKEEIRISIPNLVQNNTTIVREAYMQSMNYNTDAKQVIISWRVQHFSINIDGTKGDSLDNIIPDYTRETIAHNETMCDISNGYPIEPRVSIDADLTAVEPPAPDYSWFEGNYTGQYDFFAYLAETQPIMVNQMIRNFGLMVANWDKKR